MITIVGCELIERDKLRIATVGAPRRITVAPEARAVPN
jgi:hypothetical protein